MQKEIVDLFHNFSNDQTLFIYENTFSSKEVDIFSFCDRLRIWEPDGIPFFGDFDIYVKVYKNQEFKGFYRIEVFPWNEINLHIAFPTSNSFISRYYLRTTGIFLQKLLPISKKYKIFCVFNSSNKNVLSYMKHFKFTKIESEENRYLYNFD
jgi:hypothetical protein